MKTPELYLPTQRLEIPLGLDGYDELQLIRESQPRIIPFSSLFAIKYNYPTHPEWELEHDESGGRIYIEDRAGNRIPTGLADERGESLTPVSADGCLIRDGQNIVYSHGVIHDDRVVHIWWGVTTFDLNAADLLPGELWSQINFIDSDDFREYDASLRDR